jgi:hypothetical protein
MKKLILSTALAVGYTASVLAQGAVYFDTSNNGSTSPTATTGGQWFQTVGATTSLLNADVNAVLWGSSSQGGTYTAIATLLLSNTGNSYAGGILNGKASGDITTWGAGSFQDQSGKAVIVPGASGAAWFEIQAWTGNYSTYAAAVAGGAYVAQTSPFQDVVTSSSTAPAGVLSANPAIVLAIQNVPEPGTFALAGLGAAALLILRRRK